MRELNEEEKESLAHFAGLLFSDDTLADIMEIDRDELREQMLLRRGELYEIITRARLSTEADIRASILDMARRGSTPAQNSAEDLLRELRKNMAK